MGEYLQYKEMNQKKKHLNLAVYRRKRKKLDATKRSGLPKEAGVWGA